MMNELEMEIKMLKYQIDVLVNKADSAEATLLRIHYTGSSPNSKYHIEVPKGIISIMDVHVMD